MRVHLLYTYSGLIPPQREQAALRAIEEQHEREEKRREQEATKVALDRSLKLKLRRKVSGCGVRGHCILHMEHLNMHTDVRKFTQWSQHTAWATVYSSSRELAPVGKCQQRAKWLIYVHTSNMHKCCVCACAGVCVRAGQRSARGTCHGYEDPTRPAGSNR